MEGLHYRKKEQINKEDEAEFLDEEGNRQQAEFTMLIS